MCRVAGLFFVGLFVILPQDAASLRDVVLEIEPKVVQLGHEAILHCSYDLEGEPLYTVKWYRGHHEFYRYTPKELPSTKIFEFKGAQIDSKQSNEHQVVLREVGFNLSGNFSCEVTTDAPKFTAVGASQDMLVVVLPKSGPNLSAEKTFYGPGDTLRANCTSAPSRPAAVLTFLLNNIVVCEKCTTRKHPFQELFWSEASLEFPLFASHFHNGRLTLKCVAQIGVLYLQDAERNLFTDKDPVPARVTQSSAVTSYSKFLHFLNTIYLITILYKSFK